MRRVLGVDPGLTRCGLSVVAGESLQRSKLVVAEVVNTPSDMALEQRIGLISKEIKTLILSHEPSEIALERVFAQANLRSVMGVAQISGVVLLYADEFNIPIRFFTPTQVKAAVAGHGAADKASVGEMVKRILNLETAIKSIDAADAAAIALTAIANPGIESHKPTKAQKAWAQAIKGGRN